MTQGRSHGGQLGGATGGQPGGQPGRARGAQPGGGTGGHLGEARGYRRARLAIAALLIVLAAVGLRGALPSPRLDGPYAHDELPLAAGLEAVILVLLLVVALRHARAPRDDSLAVRLREVLPVGLGAAAFAVPLLYLLTRDIHSHSRPRPAPPRLSGTPRLVKPALLPPVSGHAAGSAAGTLVDVGLAAVLVAAIVACVLLLLRGQRSGRLPWPPGTVAVEDDGGEAKLRDAVEYGWLALRELDDARGAIIACYLAMEQSLARAGAARGIAETPDELLARAAGAGLVRGRAAARLTSVFYEARFSTRPLTAAHRDVAEQALTELAASLGDPAGAAGTAS